MPVIRIAAAVIVDSQNRILLVRKEATTAWMQPGGKLEANEAPDRALARELFEELGLTVDPATFDHWGRFSAHAANEPGHTVDCDIYALAIAQPPVAAAEIAEFRWVELDDTELEIAPLARHHVFPRLRS
jgi:8-oxo-dGTP pyrophosphatase MutT (NUDIX family)